MLTLKDSITGINLKKENSLVLDIETTGVSREFSQVIMASILDSSGGFTQLIVNNKGDEAKLLKSLYRLLDGKNIISYNGINFDIPFLKERYNFYGLESFEEEGQFDIYRYLIDNRSLTDIRLFSLQEIERYYDVERFENFEKDYDIDFYKDLENNFIESSENIYSLPDLTRVALHNKYDVINTYKILGLVKEIEDSKLINSRKAQEFFKLEDDSFKIKSIFLDKNILKIELESSQNLGKHFYRKLKYELVANYNKIFLTTSLMEGYLSPQVIGHAHILPENILDNSNSKYKLPANILYIFDGRYNLNNIKFLIEYIFEVLLS